MGARGLAFDAETIAAPAGEERKVEDELWLSLSRNRTPVIASEGLGEFGGG